MQGFEALNKSITAATHRYLGGTSILGRSSGRRPKVKLLSLTKFTSLFFNLEFRFEETQ
jgi:hypothetical protein